MRVERAAACAAAAALVAAAWLVGDGAPGLLYLLIFTGAAAAGLPAGFALFGPRHPGGWIAGALFGYVATAFGVWAGIAARIPSSLTFLVLWLAAFGVMWVASRGIRSPAVPLPTWTPGATSGLAVVVLLTLMVAAPPLGRVGMRDQQGNRYYRAYFTADFVWHTALTAELTKFSMPPRNPYLAHEPIHYYWGYFLLPAAVAQTGPSSVRDVQRCLRVNALLTGVLLMCSVFLAAWAALGRPLAVTAAAALVLVAGSAEGTYELYRLWSRGEPLGLVRDLNIDAITAWNFQGHRIDGLPRCLWYVPQHSMAYALGLVSLAQAAAVGSAGSMAAILLAGGALAGATAINPFVGGIFALAWGLAVAIDAFRHDAPLRRIAAHTTAAVPVLLAVAWCVSARMVEGAGGVLQVGLYGASLHSPFLTLFLSLGPVLAAVAAGLLPGTSIRFERVLPAAALVGLSLLLMYLVRLRVDPEWVPFRAGQMFLVAAPALAGRAIIGRWRGRAGRVAAASGFGLLLATGLPTTAIDAYNAHDVGNRDAGPGFHWTMVVTPEEESAFHWLRRATPPTAIVQMEPVVRDREGWSQIPSFGERRMAAGLPISLMRVPEYRERSEAVRTMYATADAREAWTIARGLRIQYIYVDALDRQTYAGVEKFGRAPEYFATAFKRGAVAVYEVR